ERFPKDKMLSDESIGASALYAMMTYEENRQRGAIQEFSRNGGASKQVVKGLTTQKIVSDTKAYFNNNDSFRQIAFVIADAFTSDLIDREHIYSFSLSNIINIIEISKINKHKDHKKKKNSKIDI